MQTKSDKLAIALEAIYAAAGSPGLWPRALDSIGNCFNAIGGVLIIQNQDDSLATIVSPRLKEAQLEYDSHAWKVDFLAPRLMERAMLSGHACLTEQDLATPDEIATHPFFTDFRARFGLGSIIGTVVLPHPKIPVVLSVHAALGDPAYTDDDATLLERILENVEKSLALTVRLTEAETHQLVLAEALSRLSCGVFLLDGSGKIIFKNDKASEFIGGEINAPGGCFVVSGKNYAAFVEVCRELLSNGQAEDRPPKQKQPIVVRSGCNTSVVLRVLPVEARTFDEQPFATSRFLVLATECLPAEPVDPALVRDLLELTLAESRLASLIGIGKSPREAADKLSITEETARTVLKRIFSKTGVSRQSELAALLSNVI